MKYCRAEDLTFLEWLKTISPWMWCPRIATMIYEVCQDPEFPTSGGYCDYFRYLYHERRIGDDRIECFDVLWTAFIAQTLGERWIKPEKDDECYLPF